MKPNSEATSVDNEFLHWKARGSKKQRIEYWNEVICQAVLNVQMTTSLSEYDPPFLGDIRSLAQLNSKFIEFRSSRHSISRTLKHANLSDDAFIMISLQCSGRSALQQNRQEIILNPGDIGILDSSLPFELHFPEEISRRIIMMPRNLVSSRFRQISHGKGPFKINAGFQLMPVLAESIKMLTLQDQSLRTAHTQALLESIADYVAIGLNQLTESPSLSKATFEQILHHIHHNISSPDLNVASIAMSVKVSTRTLHRLFKQFCDFSYEQYVLHRRLQLAKKILSSGNSKTISEAAFMAGFNNIPHFTRRFKEAYGSNPSSYFLPRRR